MKGPLAALGSVASFLITWGLLAVDQIPPQSFRAAADLVVLDVLVLDSSRRPVRGLIAGDFTVLENGAAQKIDAFQAIEAVPIERDSAAWMRQAQFDVQTNRPVDGRLVIIYLDDQSVGGSPFAATNARKVAHTVIDHLAPNDAAAVAFSNNYRHVQEFTTDRARLRAAVDKFTPMYVRTRLVAGTLSELAAALGAIPNRRKVIIYVGSGIRFDTQVLSTMVKVTLQPASAGMAGEPDLEGDPLALLTQEAHRREFRSVLDLFQTAQRANVTVYALDVSGLAGFTMPASPTERYMAGPPDSVMDPQSLQVLAENTGGRAIINTNAPAKEVPAIFEENGAYYLIGFQSGDRRAAGRYRRLEVRVNRPDVAVRTRRGYVEPGPAGVSEPPSEMSKALAAIVPRSDVALTLSALPFALETPDRVHVALVVGLETPRGDAPSGDHLDVAVSVFDMEGRLQGSERGGFDLTLQAGTAGTFRHQYLSRFLLRPGRYDIRVAAQMIRSGLVGSLFGDLVVPDFGREQISLSGIAVVESPAPASSPVEGLRQLLGQIPTVRRSFSVADRVGAELRVHQGGRGALAAVALSATIRDRHDAVVFETSVRLEATQFSSDRSAPYRLDLPLATLKPGPYLLRLEATRGRVKPVSREVRFAVQ